jgi:hypothetical protein
MNGDRHCMHIVEMRFDSKLMDSDIASINFALLPWSTDGDAGAANMQESKFQRAWKQKYGTTWKKIGNLRCLLRP